MRSKFANRSRSGAMRSEMDVGVKWGSGFWRVGAHGGAGAGVGRPAATVTTTVTLRCAGRDRRTVSGRGLPRTRVASWGRIERVEGSPVGRRRPPHPSGAGRGSGGGGLLVAEWLFGHRRPEEADQFAGDGDVGDRRLLAVAGE